MNISLSYLTSVYFYVFVYLHVHRICIDMHHMYVMVMQKYITSPLQRRFAGNIAVMAALERCRSGVQLVYLQSTIHIIYIEIERDTCTAHDTIAVNTTSYAICIYLSVYIYNYIYVMMRQYTLHCIYIS